MWLENLKELKKVKGATSKQIADGAMLPERTVVRIFAGETPNPTTSTLFRIVHFLGGSLDDVFAEGDFYISRKNLKTLQEELDAVLVERDAVLVERDALSIENAELKARNAELEADVARLEIIIGHKTELLAVHEHYTSLLKGLGSLE